MTKSIVHEYLGSHNEYLGPHNETFGIEVKKPELSRDFFPISRGEDGEKISYEKAIDKVKPAVDYLLPAR